MNGVDFTLMISWPYCQRGLAELVERVVECEVEEFGVNKSAEMGTVWAASVALFSSAAAGGPRISY